MTADYVFPAEVEKYTTETSGPTWTQSIEFPALGDPVPPPSLCLS